MNTTHLLLWIDASLIALMVLSASGHKLDVLPFKVAFLLFLLAAGLLSLGALVGIVGALFGHIKTLWPLIALGALPLAFFLFTLGSGSLQVPKIHDISTRSEPPIVFVEAPKHRKPSDNDIAPASERVLAEQRSYYKDIEGLSLSLEPTACFNVAVNTIEQFGWVVMAKDAEALWIEAYEASSLFGFIDDVRVEISEGAEGGCLVDARSVSRVGVSDLGMNAKRIQRLFDVLSEH